MKRFFGTVVAVVLIPIVPIYLTMGAIITAIRIIPLVTIALWKSIIVYLKTGDWDLMWECCNKEIEGL